MRKRLIAKWTLGTFLVLSLLAAFVLPFISRPAKTFWVRGHLVGLLAVPEWGFGTTSYPGYDPVSGKYGYVRVSRHGVYATVAFGGSRQPTPGEKTETL